LYPNIFPSTASYSWTVIAIVNQQWLLLPYCCLSLILSLFFRCISGAIQYQARLPAVNGSSW
jgi:hypothetical protein